MRNEGFPCVNFSYPRTSLVLLELYMLVKTNVYFEFKLFHLLDNNLLGHKADNKRKINIGL